LIWYPALPNNSKPMSTGDYIGLLSIEITLGKGTPLAIEHE
jgi:hypothetical protein